MLPFLKNFYTFLNELKNDSELKLWLFIAVKQSQTRILKGVFISCLFFALKPCDFLVTSNL